MDWTSSQDPHDTSADTRGHAGGGPSREPGVSTRIEHLPKLQVPTLFVHGGRDPFGSIEEIESARKLIPAKTFLLPVEGVGHDLGFKGKAKREELPQSIVARFLDFFVQRTGPSVG